MNQLTLEKPNLQKKRKVKLKLDIYSFFSGAGFLDFGFDSVDFNILSVNEVHEPFLTAYQHGSKILKSSSKSVYQLNSVDNYLAKCPDRIELGGSEYKNVTGFIGGPPCPDFSIAGKQKGAKGENGKLTGSYVDIICENSPHWFLLENVKGLWRTTKHREFFDSMCEKLIKSGYCLTTKLVNALEYGVPQFRERIVLVGFKSEVCDLPPGFLPQDEFPWGTGVRYDVDDVLSRPWHSKNPFGEDPKFKDKCLKRLTVEYWFKKNNVTDHPNSRHVFNVREGLSKFQNTEEGDGSKKSFKRLHRWRYSPTAAYGNNEVHLHPYEARRISVAEALAIQSLPSSYYLPENMTLTNMFKTIGNGVPFLMAEGIAKAIKTYLEGKI